MKKRIIVIMVSLLLVFALAACGSGESSAAHSKSKSTASKAAKQSTAKKGKKYSMKEISLKRDGKKIYGRLYLPAGSAKKPLVILSHGFGGSYQDLEDYAKHFARNGFAAYVYDFIGGGGSRSDGDTTEMSVLTEASDLQTVLTHFRKDSRFRRNQIYLFGASQGGFVSTYVAAKHPKKVAGLVLLYPAFVLQDDSRERNPDPENGPDTSSIMGVPVGRIYDVDAQSFDIYQVMKQYTGQTLIIHGTEDSIVPVRYSRRAQKTFPHATLRTISGADHGFYGSERTKAAEWSLSFLEKLRKSRTQASGSSSSSSSAGSTGSAAAKTSQALTMTIGSTKVDVVWQDNDAVKELRKMTAKKPLMIQMEKYGGFEQVGDIGKTLPQNDQQTTAKAGDIVLYSGDQLVVFYGSNSWAYTRLGHIKDRTAAEMKSLLSGKNVTITISQS